MDGAFSTLLVEVLAVLSFVFFFARVKPAIARARYIAELSEIRDEVDDMRISGALDDAPATERFLERVDVLLLDAPRMSSRLLFAVHTARMTVGDAELPTEPTYGDLTPESRRALHAMDAKVIAAISRVVSHGAVWWVPFLCCRPLYRWMLRRRSLGRPAATPSKLAMEYAFAAAERPTLGRRLAAAARKTFREAEGRHS